MSARANTPEQMMAAAVIMMAAVSARFPGNLVWCDAADLNDPPFEMQRASGRRPARAPRGRRSHLHHLGAIDSPAGPRLQRREYGLSVSSRAAGFMNRAHMRLSIRWSGRFLLLCFGPAWGQRVQQPRCFSAVMAGGGAFAHTCQKLNI